MENMGELPDQQINDSSVTPASSSQSDPNFVSGLKIEATASSPSELSPDSIDTIARSEAIPVSVSSMIDSGEFRTQMGELTYQTLNGRMSPSYSPNNSYATLTPLQPLPPISTVSDKFNQIQTSNVSGNFTLMNNGLGVGMDMYTYRNDKMMGMNVGPALGTSPMIMTNNGYTHQQSLGGYSYNVSVGVSQNGIPSPGIKSEGPKSPQVLSPNSVTYDPYARSLAPTPVRLHSPNPMMPNNLNGLHMSPSAGDASPHSHSASPQREIRPSTSASDPQSKQQEGEELNTKELAQRISSELKRYSIPQAVFAQRVLCRSQGTLSDLLRNPKPWSKLKSGRETFRRMWKWLQEPEFQRMSALRLAGNLY